MNMIKFSSYSADGIKILWNSEVFAAAAVLTL